MIDYLADPANGPVIFPCVVMGLGAAGMAWAGILCRRDRKASEARQRAREAADFAVWEEELADRSTSWDG